MPGQPIDDADLPPHRPSLLNRAKPDSGKSIPQTSNLARAVQVHACLPTEYIVTGQVRAFLSCDTRPSIASFQIPAVCSTTYLQVLKRTFKVGIFFFFEEGYGNSSTTTVVLNLV